MMSEDNTSTYMQWLDESRQMWNSQAVSFDNQPDHGLWDPLVQAAWKGLLSRFLPLGKASVLDIGCGTGSLSLVLAGLGFEVTGIDFSPEMIAQAEAKALNSPSLITFKLMDAAFPQFPSQHFDAIVCRHLLWILPQIGQVLQRWVHLLKPDGRLLLIEGYWNTKVGLHAQEIIDVLPALLNNISTHNLSDQADLWGGKVDDERYVIIANLQS
ncbi:MAG: class I SAM-dependent methyltransferase [Chitinophagaceae bacterium]|nr:class I SAM-dependent methyltransferase [Anaerolineae bacterium]